MTASTWNGRRVLRRRAGCERLRAPTGQVGVPGSRVARRQVGLDVIGQAEVGAQHVDAGLPILGW